ncbi:MAG: HAMP domain-containing sensor histidine kinase, partial [Rhodothermales bacterium]|nr:HAMP domain-containing sensor histidine kinase [Rhodothermales bacterium]
SNRTYAYSQAKEGRHGIEVRAQQDGFVWSPATPLTFTVSLPWYRKWWAFLIFIAVSGAVLYLMTESHNMIRTRQLKAQNLKLEKKVRERTNELMLQKSTIEQTNMDLKKALEQNHEFIGIAAHDLRNPLTSLVGFSELLIDNLDKAEPAEFKSKSKDVLPIIHRAATTMHGVIQDMLDSQMVEGGADRLRPEDIDLVELMRTVINLNNSAARRKGITIRFNPRGIFRARVDVRGMQRALDNLVSNAIKYSPPSSGVDIGITHVDGAIRVCVEDEGPGLTLDDREKVFGKLQRLSAKPTGGETSTGLGLYIVRSIVELHDGRVGVNSEPGEGAEFWIEIPSVQVRAAA